ncbi:MAG: GAF domain-containing protein [Cyclobacteriaceae bacterium]|nr:GAF domain-containing protein [Cyclobacteriaceae bacterium]MCH8517117.1 GAF domain-containing protein [Cyclobacteriaceae bacterium]
MSRLSRNISYITILSYLTIGTFTAYLFFDLSSVFIEQLQSLGLEDRQKVDQILKTPLILIAFVFMLGLFSIILLLFNQNNKNTLVQQVKTVTYNTKKDTKSKIEESESIKNEKTQRKKEFLDKIKGISTNENKKIEDKLSEILSLTCKEISAVQGALYLAKQNENIRYLELAASFAFSIPESQTLTYEFGEGLTGQAAKEGKKFNLKNVPEGYLKVISGLGETTPQNLLIIPLLAENNSTIACLELASFKEISENEESIIKESLPALLKVLNK